MTHSAVRHTTLNDWVAHEALPFSLDSPMTFNVAVDTVTASLDGSVELLGFGEALHGGEELLLLRNGLFQRLVELHSYSAIAIESSFPRGHIINEYVLGLGPDSYEAGSPAKLMKNSGCLLGTTEWNDFFIVPLRDFCYTRFIADVRN